MEILSTLACVVLMPFALAPAAPMPVASPPQAYAPKIGERHPPLVLPSIESREAIALEEYRGQRLLLIHFASW
jgi:hypothetical protein